VKSHKHRSRETTPGLPNWAVPLTETCRGLPRTSTARTLARGIGAENLPLGGRVTLAAPRANFCEIGESMGLATVDSGLTLRGN
jgi:hypothetical protein